MTQLLRCEHRMFGVRRAVQLINEKEPAMPTIRIFDPVAIQDILDRAGYEPEFVVADPSPEQRRLLFLGTPASDPRKGERDLLRADISILSGLHELAVAAPNFGEVTGVVTNLATLSLLTGSPLTLPPLFLLGPPGVGESYFARWLATALGAPMVEYAMNTAADPGVLVGHLASWRASRAGLLARTLIEEVSASPIVSIDEIGKPLWTDHGNPLDVFHTLLEPENACNLVDAYIADAPLRADKIFYVATANDVSGLLPSLLDRFLMLTIDPPDPVARTANVQNQFAQALAVTNVPLLAALDGAALDLLDDITPRQARIILDLAIASAVTARRAQVAAEDVRRAVQLVSRGKKPTRVGF